MLYLIKSWGKDGECLKIGFTDNWSKRSQGYVTHCPDYELLGTREGGQPLETYFKRKLKKYQYRKQSEWMVYNEEIIDMFNNHFPTDEEVSQVLEMRIETYLRKERGSVTMQDLDIEFKDEYSEVVKEFIQEFNSSGYRFPARILCCCKYLNSSEEVREFIPEYFMKMIDKLGTEYIIQKSGRSDIILETMDRLKDSIEGDLDEAVTGYFQVGKKYIRSQIKLDLQNIYFNLGFPTNPKATDLEKWFNIKEVRITNKETGKRDYGYEILSLK